MTTDEIKNLIKKMVKVRFDEEFFDDIRTDYPEYRSMDDTEIGTGVELKVRPLMRYEDTDGANPDTIGGAWYIQLGHYGDDEESWIIEVLRGEFTGEMAISLDGGGDEEKMDKHLCSYISGW